MRYLIFPASASIAATHTASDGSLVHITEIADTAKINSKTVPVASTAGYTALTTSQAAQALATAKATAAFNAQVAQGITAGSPAITLACDDASRSDVAQLLIHIQNSSVTGNVTIADMAGAIHTMTTDAFQRLASEYGAKYYQAWTAYKTRLAAIAAS